ncbi:MAG: His/Gly/Thr/Pro-type tRNA ligase C-terminal domain-containing protein, partial [Cyanobacteria bacterium J06626_14]
LLPVTEDHLSFARQVAEKMKALGSRVTVDEGSDRLGKMIRNAEKAKIPVMGIIGGKEVEQNTISLRVRHTGKPTEDIGSIPVDTVLERLQSALTDHTDF